MADRREGVRIGGVLSPSQIRRRLSESAAAVVRGDRGFLRETASWLVSVTPRELLRIDYHARQDRYERPLGAPEEWTSEVLEGPLPVVAVLGSMHPDGHVRERAVRSLAASVDPLSDRALAVRVTDHVGVISEPATREVLRRSRLDQADHIVPLLHRIEPRGRGSDVLPLYLHTLVAEHGEVAVLSRLRGSADHAVRRVAFRRSFDYGLLGPRDAVVLFPSERDQVVRRQLIGVIADAATPGDIARVLLRGRSAESRVAGLVKLTAEELDPADVERLLVDTSVLVRLWARRRWQEMGRDPATTYAAVARSTAKPTVRARAFIGLGETATPIVREEILDLVQSEELALRKVGLSLLRDVATAEDVPLLLRSVGGENSRVARLAGEVLINCPGLWSLPDLDALKRAHDPELRRRAWWIHRHQGGWEAVIADLELVHDTDPRLAALARQPAPPMYFTPTDAQRQRIAELLADASLTRERRLAIAMAAGLPDPVPTTRPRATATDPQPGPVTSRSRWWRPWNRRSTT